MAKMDFKMNLLYSILTGLSKIKFSIRLSILSIVLILLFGVSAVIMGINYFALNSVLIVSAKNSLFQTSGRVAEQVRGYLQPLNSNILTAYRMFSSGVVDSHQEEFSDFLYGLIVDNKDLVGAYWVDVNGNMYWLNRENKRFIERKIIYDKKGFNVTKSIVDEQGKTLTTQKEPVASAFDARLRPWYQHAAAKKSLTWVIYPFIQAGSQESQLGVTSAFPIYNSQGALKGIFGIDMPLGAISEYIKNINITENSYIFVVNSLGNLIAAHAKHGNLSMPNNSVNAIDIPWVTEAFRIYKQQPQSIFVYSVDGKNYIAAYEKIAEVKSEYPWFVVIITPVNDIVAPLRKNILLGFMLMGFALLGGVMMASIFSTSLSRPIKKLADDANWICLLQLENIVSLFSRIKEISNMADSFMKMKNALYSFQRYMPITLVKKLIISNKIAAVGGEAKELTLLFTDIQDFTKLTEVFDPEELMRYLSEYFQSITKIIIEVYGTVDKYIGDGVMAFWGAPIADADHVLHACQATIRVHEALQKLNLKWCEENKPVVITRFGISSGWVIVGNVGSDDKLNYTSLGDPVNLASRLEGLNKIYDTSIIVSEFVYEKVKDKFEFRLLDRVAVKGKKQSVYIYELLGEVDLNNIDLDLERYNSDFYQAFSSYEQGDWSVALGLFQDLDNKYPDDHLIKIFVTRCLKFDANPPPNWCGVWVMEEK